MDDAQKRAVRDLEAGYKEKLSVLTKAAEALLECVGDNDLTTSPPEEGINGFSY